MTLQYVRSRYNQYLNQKDNPDLRALGVDALFRAADCANVVPQDLREQWSHGNPISNEAVLEVAEAVRHSLSAGLWED